MISALDCSQLRTEVECGYGIAHDNPKTTDSDRLRYDACVKLSKTVTEAQTKPLTFTKFPGGVFVVARHMGDHNELSDFIRALRHECTVSMGFKLDPNRPLVEIYVDDPLFCPIEKLRTDICLPVSVSKSLEVEGANRPPDHQINQIELQSH